MSSMKKCVQKNKKNMINSQKKGRLNERRTAKKYGGIRTPGSGNKWGFKGDIKEETFLIENKYTDGKSFSITEKLWDKTCREALLESRRPAFRVEFGSGTSFVCINEIDFYEIIEKLKTNG